MFTPKNELGVVALFTSLAPSYGFDLVKISPSFPDAIIQYKGETYRAEFEFEGRNFMDHKHDPRECDLVICWLNNFPESVLPVLALSDPAWPETPLILPSEENKELAYWKYRALGAERSLQRLRTEYAEMKKAAAQAARIDWRYLPEDERGKIAGMATSEVVDAYGVTPRTARNWRHAGREEAEARPDYEQPR